MLNIGARSQSTIIPISGYTKITKWVDVSAAGLITGSGPNSSAWVTGASVIQAECDSNGVWFLNYNIYGVCTSTGVRGTYTIEFASTLASTIILNGTDQSAGYCYLVNTDGSGIVRGVQNNTQLVIYHASADNATYSLAGKVRLKAEPTWAAANMEGVANVSAYFPNASTTPGLLSYYAEGTWVPDFYFPSGSHALTGKHGAGSYIRIGNMVTVTGSLYYDGGNAGTASGLLSIADLPFTVRNNASSYFVATVKVGGWPTTSAPQLGITTPGAARIELLTRASADGRNNSSTPVDASTLAAYAEIYITCTYFI